MAVSTYVESADLANSTERKKCVAYQVDVYFFSFILQTLI